MKFLPLLAFVLLAGCQTPYTKFTVTDTQGGLISTWVAEGSYHRTELGSGYRIHAVERHTPVPVAVDNHYPNGWETIVTGPNIVRERVPKPDWLKELDGDK